MSTVLADWGPVVGYLRRRTWHRAGVLALMVAVCGLGAAGRSLDDGFERAALAGGPVAWHVSRAWLVAKGQLVTRYAGRERWPHARAWMVAPRAMPVGGVASLHIVHRGVVRRAGYVALLAKDVRSGAYVELISNCNNTAVEFRTSETEPEMRPLANLRRWVAGQTAVYGIRWQGYDEGAGGGRVELLYASRVGAEPSVVAQVAVKDLRAPDHFEIVVNAEDQAGTAPTVAFDNFHLDLTEGPDAPGDFAAAAQDRGHIRLSWTDVADEAGYVLERTAGRDGEWAELARLPADSAAYDDHAAQPSVLCRYRLRAESEKGHSNWTAAAEAVVPGPPLAPSHVVVQVRLSGQLCIAWRDNAVNEAWFVVERRLGADAPWTTFRAVGADVVAVEDWLRGSGQVAYRVRAVNRLGNSAWSEEAVAQRPAPPPTIVAPADRAVVHREADLPVTTLEIVFDRPVRLADDADDDLGFSVEAAKHPWSAADVPVAAIEHVTWDAERRRARVVFEPPIPDLVEYRIGVSPRLVGDEGTPVAAPPVRIGVLIGDDDRDGYMAPVPGEVLPRRLAMPPMPIGIMGEDIEWVQQHGAHNVEHVIELMDAYRGIDFFRINLWWDVLEPTEGTFDAKYIGFLRRLLDAAQKRLLPIEIGLRQTRWPLWVCNHKDFSTRLYEPKAAAKLADTWGRIATLCHEYPVVFAYWPISEEYPGPNELRNYLACMRRVAKALRTAHPGCVVKLRPAADPFRGGQGVTPAVTQRGPQDLCMAAGVYPNGWQWDIANPTPLSRASFANMEAFRYYASSVLGGPNGLGEIGFRATAGASFGDAERLLAFERVMTLAYDIGLVEYVIWGESWTFGDPATYFPRLLAFRDVLTRRPQRRTFDLRLVNDGNVSFAHPPYTKVAAPDLSDIFRWLEERGYKFHLAMPAAVPLLKGEFQVSLKLSELAAVPRGQRAVALQEALGGVTPTGVVLPWLGRSSFEQSLTGLPCQVEVEFPNARGTCDAVSLSPSRLQVYAPPGTLMRWRSGHGQGAWHDVVTAADSRITIVDIASD